MSKVIDLVGYRYATKAKSSPEGQRFDAVRYIVGAMFEHDRTSDAMTSTIKWTDVRYLLPETSTKWYAVLLEHVGGLKTLGGSQFVNGEWLQVRKDGFSQVTYWAEMPEELP